MVGLETGSNGSRTQFHSFQAEVSDSQVDEESVQLTKHPTWGLPVATGHRHSQLPDVGHLVSPGQRPQKVARPSLNLWVTVGSVGPEAAQHWLLCPDCHLHPVP